MKLIKCSSIIFNSCLSLVLLFFYPVALVAEDAPIHIEANSMTSTEQTSSVVFIGEVDARQADVRIRSDEMTVYYTELEKDETGKDTEKTASQQVEKLVCLGNVEITKGEWLGTSQKMTYLSKERQVILTGDAKAWQNQNMVSGEKIIYYLDEGRSEVSGDKPAMTTGGTAAGEKKPSRVNMTIRQK
ncbi:lipopolysaccharide transport periplasmic protein LptA [Desulfocastanea catecholica]